MIRYGRQIRLCVDVVHVELVNDNDERTRNSEIVAPLVCGADVTASVKCRFFAFWRSRSWPTPSKCVLAFSFKLVESGAPLASSTVTIEINTFVISLTRRRSVVVFCSQR